MDIDNVSPNTFALDFEQKTIDKLTHYSEVMDKLIGLGTHILNALREDTVTHPNKRVVILVLFRRMIELLDSASIQIEAGSILPCVGNLRTLLETLLQLEYLFNDPDRILEKCKHFMIMELDGDLEIYEKVKNEPKLVNHRPDIDKAIQSIQNQIQDSDFDDIRALYIAKVFKPNGDRKAQTTKWYSFSSNANTVQYLAGNLQKMDRYYMVYPVASNITHSSRLISDTLYIKDGIMYIKRIRDTANVDDIAIALITLAIEAIEFASKALLHDNRFSYLQARDEFNRRYKNRYRIGNR